MRLPFRKTCLLMILMIHFFFFFGFMALGIDLGYILASLWHKIPCLVDDRFLMFLLNGILLTVDKKRLSKVSAQNNMFPHCFATLFRALLLFTYVRPTSARHHFFQLEKTNRKRNVHTCTFYQGRTYKCAVSVFTILMKNSA